MAKIRKGRVIAYMDEWKGYVVRMLFFYFLFDNGWKGYTQLRKY